MKILRPRSRQELREWLMQNATTEKEALVLCSRKKVSTLLPYPDVVEEALCFGWIDSTVRRNPDGEGVLQRISPRRKDSNWSDLNKKRYERLVKMGLMTSLGRDKKWI